MKKLLSLTFLFALGVATFSLYSCNLGKSKKVEKLFTAVDLFPTKPRPAGQTHVLELRTEPLKEVRIAIIGLGMRGQGAVHRFSHIEKARIVALADVVQKNVDLAQRALDSLGCPAADGYTGSESWKEICRRGDVDLIYICAHWDLHTPIAVYAMEQGKHVATEIPAALTIEECWQLVNTAEKTRRHMMMLENCNYDFFEMATLNMAQKGLFGEIVHAEGAYIHDLRFLLFDEEKGYWDMWRLKHNEKKDGALYPMHGLGPVAHALNIHRGDRMEYLVSVSTNQFGLTEYAKEKFGAESDYAKRAYKKGDNNTTIIKTAKGKTITIQHDITSPRPYSRIHMLSGTKGFAQKWPRRGIALEPNAHNYLSDEEMDKLLKEYEHPIVKEVGEKAKKVGGHGGMDFIMDYRLIYCLTNGLPLDMDVYDAAEWSSIIELSQISVANQGMPVKIPDFTRGAWNELKTVKYYTAE
ncbi:MAG: acetylgalactosaminidase [Bacteroidetes bacterium HGW-Bacteroidetes-8]|jgi:predicted dehydrogenase|nr:MAG: acetylgalactosaminidase [Bacteroidetes bacterium HGW-Bacteroidetes-8]